MKWMFLLVLIIAGGILSFLYINLDKAGVAPATPGLDSSTKEVVVIHSFKDGTHRFSGEIKLPHSCYSIDADTAIDPKKINTLTIQITTRDRSREWSPCANFATGYEFSVIADASEDVSYSLEVDGKQQRMSARESKWESSTGTVVRPL